jgi:hypothetical protein
MGRSIVSLLLNVLAVSTAVVDAGVLVKKQAPPTTLPTNWSYKGCYTDGINGRTLRSSASNGADMTAAKCIAYCGARGYSLAGTEYSNVSFGTASDMTWLEMLTWSRNATVEMPSRTAEAQPIPAVTCPVVVMLEKHAVVPIVCPSTRRQPLPAILQPLQPVPLAGDL